MQVTFIGLGVMGFPMAGHLHQAGLHTTVFNRTFAKAQAWAKQYGGRVESEVAKAVSEADIVCMCLGNDDDVRSLVYGDKGILAGLKQGALLIDHTTTSASLAVELGKACQAQGASFLDAPVSGGEAGAQSGQLTVMIGGDEADIALAAPIWRSYSKSAKRLGPHGSGQKCKMVNQICIAGLLQGLSEGIRFAQHAGLDVTEVIDTIKYGAAQSWQLENRATTMAQGEFDFGFAIDWMHKDLSICLQEAKHNGAKLPITEVVDSFYQSLQQQGHGRADTSALIKLLS
ncbi:NAD(P)-dependent oxidoreductase [Motilimonas pumila]|uniref:NAD(P)-dependent oxidoreductase n=1 Tax=Motilimonas pumila TaxID=2303987 RepID=A0A418YCW3_9GAMM|nr:NAD(P)-dependent oxidoreductase [Motilimonas pumila]RJG42335.1 NAD(P)-dependent oxidoreductase [Motilimonas pumila]